MGNVNTEVRAGVGMSKRAVDIGRSTRIEYRFHSMTGSTVDVSLVECLPESVAQSELTFPDDDGIGEWEYVNDRRLTYTVTVTGSGTVETVFTVPTAVETDALDSKFFVSACEAQSTVWSRKPDD